MVTEMILCELYNSIVWWMKYFVPKHLWNLLSLSRWVAGFRSEPPWSGQLDRPRHSVTLWCVVGVMFLLLFNTVPVGSELDSLLRWPAAWPRGQSRHGVEYHSVVRSWSDVSSPKACLILVLWGLNYADFFRSKFGRFSESCFGGFLTSV